MRSLKMQILISLLGSLFVLSVSFMIVLGWHMKDRALAAASIKAKTDLATCTEIIDRTYPGSWQVQDGILFKGQEMMTKNTQFVDRLAELTGDTVTFFLGDTRVATTVRGSNGERAIGTKVSDAVAQTVLKNGQIYLGQANVVGQVYETAYEPLRDMNGNIIGIFYVGISHSYEQEMIVNSLFKMAFLGAILTLIVGLLAWLFVQKVIINPLHNITLGTWDVATGHATEKVEITGSKEIEELAGAFNQMVERLQSLAGDIGRVTENDKTPLTSLGLQQADVHARQDGKVTQTDLLSGKINPDLSLSLNIQGCMSPQGLPKGLNEATLKQIILFLEMVSGPVSAEEVGEGVKLTRVTVRRYLEFLEQCGVLEGELKYGTVGRPVKLFSRAR